MIRDLTEFNVGINRYAPFSLCSHWKLERESVHWRRLSEAWAKWLVRLKEKILRRIHGTIPLTYDSRRLQCWLNYMLRLRK